MWIAFLTTLAALTAAAVARWRRTSRRDREYGPRRDTAYLLVVSLAASAIAMRRAHYLLGTRSFYNCTWALAPLAMLAVYLVARLLRVYREQHR